MVDTGKMLAAKGLVIVEIVKKTEKYYLFKAKYIDFESGTTQKTKSDYFEYDLNEFKELNNFGKKLIINTMIKKENTEELKEIETSETIENKINDKLSENQTINECEYKIYSNISGANIYIDNKYKGTTPLTINIKRGKHTIKAIKENYTVYFGEISIFEDDELYITLTENKIIDENKKKSKEFFSELNLEAYTSYKYLDFKNAETKNIFTIGVYVHYLYVRFDNFSLSVVGGGLGYCNDDLLEGSLHLGEVKYFIKNIELNLSLLMLLGRMTFIVADDKDEEKDIVFHWGSFKVGYFYQTDDFTIRPFIQFGLGQLEEKDKSYSDKTFGGNLGFIYGFGISIDLLGKKTKPIFFKRK